MKIRYIYLLLISLCFSYNDSWSTTRFEYWWNSNFNKMLFREPISFIPYRIKIGSYEYGGTDFWNQNIINNVDTLITSPIITINGEKFTYINDKKYRKGTFLDIDFLSYNFLKNFQNTIDMTIGFGYQFRKPSYKVNIPYEEGSEDNWFDQDLGEIYYHPILHNFKINSSLLFPFNEKCYTYYNFSYGSLKTYLFETSDGDLLVKGEGFSKSHAIGINIISPVKNKNYDLHYGIELKFDKMIIDNIKDDIDANIEKIKMQEISMNFNIGVGYGGKSTIGDAGYSNMINSKYIEAVENFEKFKQNYPKHSKIKLADKMINFSNNKVAYQMFQNGNDNYKKSDYKTALIWYEKALLKADKILQYEINSRKYIIANDLLKNRETYIKNHTLDESIIYMEYISSLSNKINYKAQSIKVDLLFKKADIFISNKNYKSAYGIYISNKDNFPDKAYISNGKISFLISNIINDINIALQIKDYILAYEYMYFLNQVYPDNITDLKENIIILKEELDNSKRNRIKDITQNIVKGVKKEFDPFDNSSRIIIGDKYNKIIRLLGKPDKVTKKMYLKEEYIMALFSFKNKSYHFYFKDDKLFEIEELYE